MKLFAIAFATMALTLVGCGDSEAEKQAHDQALDNKTDLVTSCSADGISDVSISTVSWVDTSAICERMAHRIGRNPSVEALRKLSRAVSVMQSEGYPGELSDNAYQFMRVVEERGQLEDESAMLNTFDVVFKVYQGTEKRVTPKDLNKLLSDFGAGASKLSDDGVYGLAAVLDTNKQNNGE